MRYLISFFLCLTVFTSSAFAVYFKYRENGGEVVGASVNSYNIGPGSDFSQVQDPSTPDGKDLSIPKIYTGTEVRNATQGEIENFEVAEKEDNYARVKEETKKLFDRCDQDFVRLLAAVKVMVKHINQTKQGNNDTIDASQFKTEFLNAIDSLAC